MTIGFTKREFSLYLKYPPNPDAIYSYAHYLIQVVKFSFNTFRTDLIFRSIILHLPKLGRFLSATLGWRNTFDELLITSCHLLANSVSKFGTRNRNT